MPALLQRLQAQREAVNAAAPALVRQMAATGLALRRLAVQQRGIVGAAYSSRLISTFYFQPQALNAGGRDYIKRNRLGNWAGLRAAEGLQTAFVDFTHRGRTWNSLHAQEGPGSGGVFTAPIVASDQESARILQKGFARYGNFLALEPAESAEVQQVAVVAIKRILEATP